MKLTTATVAALRDQIEQSGLNYETGQRNMLELVGAAEELVYAAKHACVEYYEGSEESTQAAIGTLSRLLDLHLNDRGS